MKEKADRELNDLRKVAGNSKQHLAMLKQSLEVHIGADHKDLNDEKSGKAAAEQQRTAIESDLSGSQRNLQMPKLVLQMQT